MARAHIYLRLHVRGAKQTETEAWHARSWMRCDTVIQEGVAQLWGLLCCLAVETVVYPQGCRWILTLRGSVAAGWVRQASQPARRQAASADEPAKLSPANPLHFCTLSGMWCARVPPPCLHPFSLGGHIPRAATSSPPCQNLLVTNHGRIPNNLRQNDQHVRG